MEAQQQVLRIPGEASSLCHIAAVLGEREELDRTALAERLCRDFGFPDAPGSCADPGLHFGVAVARAFRSARASRGSDAGRELCPAWPCRAGCAGAGRTLGGGPDRGQSLEIVPDATDREIWHGLTLSTVDYERAPTDHLAGHGPPLCHRLNSASSFMPGTSGGSMCITSLTTDGSVWHPSPHSDLAPSHSSASGFELYPHVADVTEPDHRLHARHRSNRLMRTACGDDLAGPKAQAAPG